MSWSSFIEGGAASQHAVHVYDELTELVASVGSFLAAGFRAGAPAILIAKAEHLERFEADLDSRGFKVDELKAAGLLSVRDANETLAAIMDGAVPSDVSFERVVGGLVDEVAGRFPDTTPRLFGEMVDVLWHGGNEHAAVALEELWNDLGTTRRFSLLCGYHLDIFDVGVQTEALPAVFRVHTHARPADGSRLSAALDQALAEVVGPMEAARIYLNVAEQVPPSNLPRAQAVLGWLSTTRQPAADRILERTRTHYVRLRQAPTASFAA